MLNTQALTPLSISCKKLLQGINGSLDKDERRVLLNILKMAKENGSWGEFSFEKYYKESADSRRSDEDIIHDNFIKQRAWLADPQAEGRYVVTEALIDFLRPFSH